MIFHHQQEKLSLHYKEKEWKQTSIFLKEFYERSLLPATVALNLGKNIVIYCYINLLKDSKRFFKKSNIDKHNHI